MKTMTGITLAGLAALTAGAVTFDVPRLPAPAFADGESSGDAALPAGRFVLFHSASLLSSKQAAFYLIVGGTLHPPAGKAQDEKLRMSDYLAAAPRPLTAYFSTRIQPPL